MITRRAIGSHNTWTHNHPKLAGKAGKRPRDGKCGPLQSASIYADSLRAETRVACGPQQIGEWVARVRAGAEAREMVGFDAGKRVKGRQRHLATDTLGLMLRIEVHAAGVQDRDGAAPVFDHITRRFPFIERFFADAGCQGSRVAAAAPRPVEIIKRTDTGFVVQPKRWVT